MRSIAKIDNRKTKTKQIKAIAMVCCLALGGLLGASFAMAQNTAETSNSSFEDVYRIEMIIFKRGDYTDDRYANSETWPKNIDLYYPENIQSLFTLEQLNSAITQYENNASLYGLNASDIDQRVKNNSIVTLPVNSRSLRQEARRVMARREIRVLFHEAWDQKLEQNGDKIPLAVTGGEQFGNHFQLEGSVRVHRSRFLHVKTQLWLSAFEANHGQELQYWPELPSLPVPLGPEFNQRRSVVEESNRSAMNGRINSWSDINNNSDANADSFDDQASGTLANRNLTGGEFTESQQAPRFSDDPFIIKNIMTLNQSRRMRSNEIHYIDHPRMGVIVKIVPLESTSHPDDG